MAVLGMSVVVLGYGGYLTMLFVLRRFTYGTWIFHAVILVGIVLALIGLAVGDTGLPAWIAIGLGLAWFPVTRRELTLVGSERLTLQAGDRLPHFAALRPDGTPITDQDVVAGPRRCSCSTAAGGAPRPGCCSMSYSGTLNT